MRSLENLRWDRGWVSHLGCIKGCLDHLGIEVSKAWLYGGTGHAFILNMTRAVCPSGPTAWKAEKIITLGRNLGYDIRSVFGRRGDNFAQAQQQAWQLANDAIEHGQPCYGWELDVPEYYVVYGCDDTGYYYSGPGCDDGKGPKPWQELGDTGIGIVEMYSLEPGRSADDATVVRDALSFAVEFAGSPAKWVFPNYRAGLLGYDFWIHAVETGSAHGLGMWYNAAVWAECRRFAVEFLREAAERLGPGLEYAFSPAIESYTEVASQLQTVSNLYPPSEGPQERIQAGEHTQPALEALRKAREAEAMGLAALARIVTSIHRS